MEQKQGGKKFKRDTPTVTRVKLIFVAVCFSIVFSGILIGRLFKLQILDSERYKQLAVEQQMKSKEISPQRGTIYDRNMRVLAQSVTAWTIVVDPSRIVDTKDKTADQIRREASHELAEILELDEEKILKKCSAEKSNWQMIKKRADKEEADKIKKLKSEKGYGFINIEFDTKRIYPNADIASAVLGFVNFDGKGASGIESYYNKILSGTPGQITSLQTGISKEMPYSYQELYEAKDGDSLVLTFDTQIQEFLERELETAIIEFGVRNGATGIVMNTKTGEILAMASFPDFDPNNPQEITDKYSLERLDKALEKYDGDKESKAYQEAVNKEKQKMWRNKAVSEPYEPGSVFKLITSAAALDCGTVGFNSSFYCPGYIEVAGRKIHCHKLSGHGQESFVEAVQNSCNPAFIQIGQKLGSKNFYKYFEAFGFTKPTGIDLPAEAESIYHSEKNLGIAQLSSSSFGQTFKVTPIQLMCGVSAAVCGGELMQPFVVKQIVDAEGNVVEIKKPIVKRQVIPEETAKKVAYLGRMVVDGGSGRRAGVLGYEIGGKTGTSEKLDLYDENGVKLKQHILSFLGFAPADDPQIAILVTLDDPSLANVYGSSSAAPVVGAVFREILPYLGIEPTEKQETKEIYVPYLIGQKPHDAQSELTLKGLDSEIVGDGLSVLKQVPATGEKIPLSGKVILYTTETDEIRKVAVPNVIGLTAQEANKTILNSGLNIKADSNNISGDSRVVSYQYPNPGEQLEIGKVVEIRCREKENPKN